MNMDGEEARRIFAQSDIGWDDLPIYFTDPDHERYYKLDLDEHINEDRLIGVRVNRVWEESIEQRKQNHSDNGHFILNKLCEHLAQGTYTPITPNEFYEQFDEVAGKLRNI